MATSARFGPLRSGVPTTRSSRVPDFRLAHDVSMYKLTLVRVWRSKLSSVRAARKGHRSRIKKGTSAASTKQKVLGKKTQVGCGVRIMIMHKNAADDMMPAMNWSGRTQNQGAHIFSSPNQRSRHHPAHEACCCFVARPHLVTEEERVSQACRLRQYGDLSLWPQKIFCLQASMHFAVLVQKKLQGKR
jgi:hypothetical protein